MVSHRTKVFRSTFRNLPFGKIYFVASNNTGPFIKVGRHSRLATNGLPQTTAPTAVADSSIGVVTVGKFFTGSQRAI